MKEIENDSTRKRFQTILKESCVTDGEISAVCVRTLQCLLFEFVLSH
jgi:hypothetical protein